MSEKQPVRFELIDKDGNVVDWGNSPAEFKRAADAARYARQRWPDQEQDPDRTGKGWDVQVSRASHYS